jgi:hypothetical protein
MGDRTLRANSKGEGHNSVLCESKVERPEGKTGFNDSLRAGFKDRGNNTTVRDGSLRADFRDGRYA